MLDGRQGELRNPTVLTISRPCLCAKTRFVLVQAAETENLRLGDLLNTRLFVTALGVGSEGSLPG